MKKKIFLFLIFDLILIAGVVFYLFNEYKTKNLVQDFFDTDFLVEETHDISIIDTERNVNTVKKDSTVFPTFINSLEKLEIKRTNAEFNHTGFAMVIYHNNALHNININENGLLKFNNKTYEIQNKQAFEKFLKIVKKSTQ